MRDFLSQAKALSDENRVRVLCVLRHRELCVCQIIQLLKLAPSTVSKHMSILLHAGLVESRKQGRWVHYRLAERGAPAGAREAIAWACRSLRKASAIRRDAERIKKILKMSPTQLCRNQCAPAAKPAARRL